MEILAWKWGEWPSQCVFVSLGKPAPVLFCSMFGPPGQEGPESVGLRTLVLSVPEVPSVGSHYQGLALGLTWLLTRSWGSPQCYCLWKLGFKCLK